MRIILFLIFGLILIACESESTNPTEELVLSENVKISSNGQKYIHHIEDAEVQVELRNLSNQIIYNTSGEFYIEQIDINGNLEVLNNAVLNSSISEIAPFETKTEKIQFSKSGTYNIGYKLSFSKESQNVGIIISNNFEIEQFKTFVSFRQLSHPIFSSTPFCVSKNYFYVINSAEELDFIKNEFSINNDKFYDVYKGENFTDSTIIGYSSARAAGSGAHLSTDSLVNIKDTINVYYTYDTRSVYLDVTCHGSIIIIGKTELPIRIGEIKVIE